MVRLSVGVAWLCASGCLCTTEESTKYVTAQLSEETEVYVGRATADVHTTLHVANTAATYAQVVPPDVLQLYVDGQPTPLHRDTLLGKTSYAATGLQVRENTELRVALERTGQPSAVTSVGWVPSPIAITAPAAYDHVRLGTQVIVTWDPRRDDPVRAVASGSCIETATVDVADVGWASLQLKRAAGAESCTVTLKVQRLRQGALDPALAGGTYELHADAEETVTVDP